MINQDFNSILELLKAFPDEQTCINHLEQLRWNGNVVSPFDIHSKVYACKDNKYRCKNTGKYFNVKTGTLFDNTKVPLQKWFLAIWLITSHKKGISSLQLGRDIDVTQKTGWFMLQRIRNCFFDTAFGDPMDTVVEVDETYVGGKESNKHGKTKNYKGHNSKTTVVGLIERGETVRAKVVESPRAKHIIPFLLKNVPPETIVITDQYSVYTRLGTYYRHYVLNHARGEYANKLGAHTNTIEGFWSLLKRSIIGIYHHTSPRHLQKYVDEMAFRYNTRDNSESGRFNLLLTNTEHRLTYKKLIK